MIDDDIAYVSPSTVYRVLKAHDLVFQTKQQKTVKEYYNPHKPVEGPDYLWQTDITYISFNYKMYFLLIFIDVYSRYIPYHVLLTNMTSYTVSQEFRKALEINDLLRNPELQSDNGSCFVGEEFKKLISELKIKHHYIAPHCPNQNAEVERCNRTVKEELLNYPIPETFTDLTKTIDKVIDYYNNERYHSSLGFLPPKIYYRGEPSIILDERKEKIELAKKRRIVANLKAYNDAKSSF